MNRDINLEEFCQENTLNFVVKPSNRLAGYVFNGYIDKDTADLLLKCEALRHRNTTLLQEVDRAIENAAIEQANSNIGRHDLVSDTPEYYEKNNEVKIALDKLQNVN